MSRWIDDIVQSIQNHPHISPVHKILLIARVEQSPTKAEVDSAAQRYKQEQENG